MGWLAHLSADGTPTPGEAPRPPRFPWVSVALLAAILVALSCCTGCALFQQTRDGATNTHTLRKYREVNTIGGKMVVEETFTDSAQHSETSQGFDPSLASGLQQGVTAIGQAAAGDWTGAIATGIGAVTTIGAAYAASQKAKADAQRQRADEHKADAAEAWAKLDAIQKDGA